MVVVPARSAVSRNKLPQLSHAILTLVIDRQPLFVAALGSLLTAPPLAAEVLSSSRSDTGLEIIRGHGVDVVFCDLRAEPMSGPEFARVLATEKPRVPVILLGDRDDESDLTTALHSSAAGLFTKDASLDEFLVGVRAVLSGHRAIGASLMERVLSRLSQPQLENGHRAGNQLSPTELEILAMIGHAQSIRSIAASRGISSKTVRNHLARIYRKLNVHGRTEAMLWATRTGLTRA